MQSMYERTPAAAVESRLGDAPKTVYCTQPSSRQKSGVE